MKQLGLILGLAAAAGCSGAGDGREHRLSLGFPTEARPIAVGVELQLAVERPRERDHFCVGHCALDGKLEPLLLTRVFSSRPDVVEVVSPAVSEAGVVVNSRAPLVRIRTLRAGETSLTVEGMSRGKVISDSWTLEARPLSHFEVSQTRLPENSRVELLLTPVSDDGSEVYAGPMASRLQGAAELTADQRAAVQVQTGAAGMATLEVHGANRTQLVHLEIGRVEHASAR